MADSKPARPRGGRRKSKKNIPFGQAHIKTSFNNTIVSLTDKEGNVIAWESAGGAGFKGSRKSTPFAAQVTADAAARKGMEQGLQKVEVFVKGAGSGRETAIRSLQAAGLEVTRRPRRHPAGPQRLPPPQAAEGLAMARDGPQCKQCRREGMKLFLKGERCMTDKCGDRAPQLPARRARPRALAPVGVPRAAAREAEGAPLLRRAREAVPQLLRQGQPPGRRHRREPAAPARDAASTTCSSAWASPARAARRAS